MTPLDPLAWKQLVDAIVDEKCILFLGPGVTINYTPAVEQPSITNRQELFFKELATQYPQHILSYHEDDGFLVFKGVGEKRLLLSEIKTFYRKTQSNPVLDQIAQIPFHLLVVVTPDMSVNKAFSGQEFSFKHQSYGTKIKRTLEEVPTSEVPLIYNLFGCESEPESLITTHGDFFDLVQSIYGDKNLPDELVSFFNGDSTHNIIFLGFEFDKWYFQMLLHLLRIKFDAGFLYAAAQRLPAADNQMLMESHFRVSFVSTDIESFVQTLHSHFDESQLRKKGFASRNRSYNKANVLNFLTHGWTPQEFETFCLIHFGQVYAEFTPNMVHSTRIYLLMQYLEVHGGFDKLLAEGRTENLFQYEACGPYDVA
jgi:hypothetical protein